MIETEQLEEQHEESEEQDELAEAHAEDDETEEIDDALLLLQEDLSDDMIAIFGYSQPQSEFRITDADSADWAANKIRSYEREIADRKAAAARAIKRIESKLNYFRFRFEPQLREFAAQELAQFAGKKKPPKSFELPCGARIGTKAVAKNFEVEDAEKYNAWVHVNIPDAVKDWIPKIDKAVVNAQFVEGVVPEGVKVTEAHDKFYVKFK